LTMAEANEARAEGDGWVRVRAPSRLHFGLLAIPHVEFPTHWPDLKGNLTVPVRNYGGVGLMVQAPGLDLAMRSDSAWSAEGPLADRALQLAMQMVHDVGAEPSLKTLGPCRILITKAGPEHMGLGAGTQLALAVTTAFRHVFGLRKLGPAALARQAARGERSAVGVHGFFRGGFLIEGGQRRPNELGRVVAREDFPNEWKVLLVLPPGDRGLFGHGESSAFVGLLHRPADLELTEALCRLALLGLMPALQEKDLQAFGEALYDFNRRAGEMFRTVQGGIYAHPRTQAIVDWLRTQEIRGVGQSSWGPAVFAIVLEDQTVWLKRELQKAFGLGDEEIICTAADNSRLRLSTC
jgi:beta-ribofuranosylaminobenzene 5'-phosphate synthase